MYDGNRETSDHDSNYIHLITGIAAAVMCAFRVVASARLSAHHKDSVYNSKYFRVLIGACRSCMHTCSWQQTCQAHPVGAAICSAE